MTVPTNLYQRDSLNGAREDLIEKIFNTSPTETPLTSSFGRVTASSVFHEWQRDALGAANANNGNGLSSAQGAKASSDQAHY